MLFALLAASLLPSPAAAIVGVAEADAPPVRLWMNGDREYRPGESVRVQVETGVNGYLLVMRVDPEGMVRVLFPVRPGDDAFVAGGRRYEVRDVGDAESFVAAETGPGYVWAAIAPAPWRFELASVAGTWDYGLIRLSPDPRDPEAELTELAQRLAPAGGFDYDALDYVVVGSARGFRYDGGPPPPGWWSPAHYGYWYDDWDDYRYRYAYDCFGCRRYRHVYMHIGLGSSWYWPTYWYRPWYYSYRTLNPYYPPYWGHDYDRGIRGPIVVRPSERPVVVGRPRDYTVERRNPFGGRGRPVIGERGDAGPRGSVGAPARDDRPPARRARPRPSDDGPSRGSARPGNSSTDRGDRGGSAGRPSNGGSSGSPPARSRPRDDRPDRGSAISVDRGASTAGADAMFIERSRPSSDRRTEVRMPVNARSPEARPVDRRDWPVNVGRARGVERDPSPARRVEVNRDRGPARVTSVRGADRERARAQPSREPARAAPRNAARSSNQRDAARPTNQRDARPAPRPAPARSSARPASGGKPSASKAAPAKSGNNRARARPRDN